MTTGGAEEPFSKCKYTVMDLTETEGISQRAEMVENNSRRIFSPGPLPGDLTEEYQPCVPPPLILQVWRGERCLSAARRPPRWPHVVDWQ